MTSKRVVVVGSLALLGLAGCSTVSKVVMAPLHWMGMGASDAQVTGIAADPNAFIDADELLKHIRVLSSDRFEGRLPGTLGEELTVEYLEARLHAMGVSPGNPDGSYRQSVSLAGLTSQADVGINVRGKPLRLKLQDDIVVSTARLDEVVRVRKSPIVFVGYGVQAPEYAWDDYKGMDLRGKTLLMLVNDPQVVDPQDPAALDPHTFKGAAMTYYGRWTYKHEIAARLGADAVLVIHETGPAGYPWEVVSRGGGQEHFTLDVANRNSDRVPVHGWISDRKVSELLAASGADFSQLKQAANRSDFRPVALAAEASFQVRNDVRQLSSTNVLGLVRGTKWPDEYVIYTAHWDHLGRDMSLDGDQIFNGALDNASGTAGLLELAQVFAARPAERSVLFLAVTAEEQGLLGSRYYASNPVYPLSKTLANINMDGLTPWGRTSDMVVVGTGQNSLEDVLSLALAAQGRHASPEAEPEKGMYFRSDHFEFARQGVPALYAGKGVDFVDHSPEYGLMKRREYTANDYHKVSDEVKYDWDMSGAVEDLQALEDVGRRVAAATERPYWKPGSEFARVNTTRHP